MNSRILEPDHEAASGDREPGCLTLHRTGELRRRAEAAAAQLSQCRLCPRACGVDRARGERGFCDTGAEALVASYGPHFGEESCLVGNGGSGTIFFASCTLRCVFCQNHDISHGPHGQPASAEHLARIMLALQAAGCANINLVTPTHFVPQILGALVRAADAGFRLPIVYNTSGYETARTLAMLDGVVDIYMPDLKTLDAALAGSWFAAADYPDRARSALRIMHGQAGPLLLDARGIAWRGVLVRHLVMPDHPDDTRNVMRWLADDLGRETFVNVMGQYHPCGDVGDDVSLSRRLDPGELRRARAMAREAGLTRFA